MKTKTFATFAVFFCATIALASSPGEKDQASRMTEVKFHTLEELEKQSLTSGSLKEQPWSGSYWPIYAGSLAWRYGDPSFPKSSDFHVNQNYVESNLGVGTSQTLSPAEKYDLLIGDNSFTFTREMFKLGDTFVKKYGHVESWMGICHGWSQASYMAPRPEHAITVLAADGKTQLTFYPDDIKALLSQLWAKTGTNIVDAGVRCEKTNPGVDSQGRETDPECLDSNPATWHQTVTHKIGLKKEGFIIDVVPGYQVWNHPVYSYKYTYFNPKTKQDVTSLKKAIVAADSFNDPRRAFRDPRTKSLVGIKMNVKYGIETLPTASSNDSPKDDALTEVNYIYDLELDDQNSIIGGEWLSEKHPDVLWTPQPMTQAMSEGDIVALIFGDTKSWNGSGTVPFEWQGVAKKDAEKAVPFGKIVNVLLELSRTN